MIVEEAKQIIKDRPSFAYMSYTDRVRFSEALDVAVRSLDAIGKIADEMDHCSDYYELGSMVIKHLKEVENEADN